MSTLLEVHAAIGRLRALTGDASPRVRAEAARALAALSSRDRAAAIDQLLQESESALSPEPERVAAVRLVIAILLREVGQ